MVLCIMEFRNAFPASFLLLPVKLLRFHWLICTPVGSRSRCRLRYCIGQANNNSFDCFFHSLILSFPENCWFREAFLFLLAIPGIIMLLRNSKCQKRDNTQEKWGKINKNSFVPYLRDKRSRYSSSLCFLAGISTNTRTDAREKKTAFPMIADCDPKTQPSAVIPKNRQTESILCFTLLCFDRGL